MFERVKDISMRFPSSLNRFKTYNQLTFEMNCDDFYLFMKTLSNWDEFCEILKADENIRLVVFSITDKQFRIVQHSACEEGNGKVIYMNFPIQDFQLINKSSFLAKEQFDDEILEIDFDPKVNYHDTSYEKCLFFLDLSNIINLTDNDFIFNFDGRDTKIKFEITQYHTDSTQRFQILKIKWNDLRIKNRLDIFNSEESCIKTLVCYVKKEDISKLKNEENITILFRSDEFLRRLYELKANNLDSDFINLQIKRIEDKLLFYLLPSRFQKENTIQESLFYFKHEYLIRSPISFKKNFMNFNCKNECIVKNPMQIGKIISYKIGLQLTFLIDFITMLSIMGFDFSITIENEFNPIIIDTIFKDYNSKDYIFRLYLREFC